MASHLGEILVEADVLKQDQLEKAIEENRKQETGELLGETIVRMGLASERDIARAISHQLGMPFVDLEETAISPDAVQRMDMAFAKENTMIPVHFDGDRLVVAMMDPLDVQVIDDAEFMCGAAVRPAVATPSQIEAAINTQYRLREALDEMNEQVLTPAEKEAQEDEEAAEEEGRLVKLSGDMAPNVRLVNGMLAQAIQSGASDVHIEPQEDGLIVRNRLDGLLREAMNLPKWAQGAVISRVKVMSGMDITKHSIPQDGKVSVVLLGKEYDLRVSALPAKFGEKIVIRVLDKHGMGLCVEELGLASQNLAMVQQLAKANEGMVLVCGPTGSGKTTTLYSMINSIRDSETNVVTIEDPVEYQLEGINQVQVRPQVGLTFANVLRSVLRQDPDVVLVGEIRDAETAKIALQAAVTGHLVLSTVHTINSVAAIPRLVQLGAEPYLVASGLNGVLAQRLVRKLCASCRVECKQPSEALLRLIGKPEEAASLTFYQPAGCDQCAQSGYKGRVGVFEMFQLNSEAEELIHRGASENEMRAVLFGKDGRSMLRSAIDSVREGITSPDEVLRVIPLEEGAAPEGESRNTCPSCKESTQAEWQACPYCGSTLRELEPSSAPRVITDIHDVRSADQEETVAIYDDEAPATVTETAQTDTDSSSEEVKVLVVGSDQVLVRRFAAFLLKEGFSVSTVTGPQALGLTANSLPDLIVTVVSGQEKGGIQAVKMFRKEAVTSDIPIAMLSPRGTIGEELQAFAAGCDDYIAKPFSKPVILARIKALLRLVRREAKHRADKAGPKEALSKA